MEKEELIAKLEKFAEEHEIGFSAQKSKLIEAILKNKGYCPCRRVKSPSTICPCAYALEEIKQQNKCLCGLFVKVRLK
ncbi:MAG: ferredoxin-thioredoxin reductase catalytic domain-containing protein [Candidatus Thermoplasmatota archaeon]|nr:ferredoxin-thioredoxin reductase catalytic domain-containing protein [Candidatus Thermoplasmatota archaeon]